MSSSVGFHPRCAAALPASAKTESISLSSPPILFPAVSSLSFSVKLWLGSVPSFCDAQSNTVRNQLWPMFANHYQVPCRVHLASGEFWIVRCKPDTEFWMVVICKPEPRRARAPCSGWRRGWRRPIGDLLLYHLNELTGLWIVVQLRILRA